jgi:hypothetical protein
MQRTTDLFAASSRSFLFPVLADQVYMTHYPDPPGLSVWTYIEATILTSHDENHRGPAFACACLAILFVLLPCVILNIEMGRTKLYCLSLVFMYLSEILKPSIDGAEI